MSLRRGDRPVAFDEFGDTTTKIITAYKVTGGKWVADEDRKSSSSGGASPLSHPPRAETYADGGRPGLPPSGCLGSPAGHQPAGRSGVELFLQQLVNGLSLGALYALIAVGYTVVYGIIQLINFAHGEIFMIGAFGALTAWIVVPGEAQACGCCHSCCSSAWWRLSGLPAD